MTEERWLHGKSLYDMLERFPTVWDERKLWLFGCACFRRCWHFVLNPRTRACVEVAERYVDGSATGDQLDAAWQDFDTAAHQGTLTGDLHLDSYEAVRNLVGYVDPAASLSMAFDLAEAHGGFTAELRHPSSAEGWSAEKTQVWKNAEFEERQHQADLLRDIFGNPFRPVAFDPAWRSEAAVGIARGIYDDRAFERLPILADALQDAGCEHPDILAHCREPGVHVRGCWVADLVLGKA